MNRNPFLRGDLVALHADAFPISIAGKNAEVRGINGDCVHLVVDGEGRVRSVLFSDITLVDRPDPPGERAKTRFRRPQRGEVWSVLNGRCIILMTQNMRSNLNSRDADEYIVLERLERTNDIGASCPFSADIFSHDIAKGSAVLLSDSLEDYYALKRVGFRKARLNEEEA